MGASNSQLQDAIPLPVDVGDRTTLMFTEPDTELEQEEIDTRIKTPDDSNHSLCGRCRNLKLDEFPFTDGRLRLDLGIPISWDLGKCSACNLFFDLILDNSPEFQTSRVYLKSDIIKFERCMEDSNPEPDHRVAYLSAFLNSGQGFLHYKPITPPISFLRYETNSNVFGKLRLGTQVDFRVINKWLHRCKLDHACHKPSSSIELTLINCKTRELERKVSSEAFVALSYVWGPSPMETRAKLLSIGSILSNLPLLIEDALQVCNEIDIDYLWVDRYCISQDPEESHRQIANMDAVYNEAVLTIIAAAYDTPYLGLPGVNNTKRVGQASLRIGDWVLIPCLPSPQAIVYRSKWNSRGWTYQEAILSSRRLYFTEEQVFLECQSGFFQEASATQPWDTTTQLWDATRSNTYWHIPTAYDVGTTRPHLFVSHDRMAQKDIWTIINSYSSRSLSYPSDTLNAMLGIFRFFSRKRLNPLYHHWGIPFGFQADNPKRYTDSAKEFLHGLFWESNKKTRREGFPSWSWTGWIGTAGQIGRTYHQTFLGNSTIVIELKNGIHQTWQEFTDTFQTTDPSLFSTHIQITIPTLNLQFSCFTEDKQQTYFVRIRHSKDFPTSHTFPLHLTRSVEMQSGLHSQIIGKPLTCMVYGDPRVSVLCAMVLIEENGCFERIGYISSDPAYFIRDPVEKTGVEDNAPYPLEHVLLNGKVDPSCLKIRTIRLG